ncbi:TPA: class I SAM-dependent methyltransferase [Providencia alcalifaciens]
MIASFFSQKNHYQLYIKNFIASPASMGTVMPSSRWLCYAIVSNIDWRNCIKIAEIGAGNGVMMRYIANEIPEKSSLELYEINRDFIAILNQIDDPRVTVKPCSAEYLRGDYDLIISGLPFLSLHKKTSMRILKKVRQSLLKNHGRLVLFQYTQGCERLFSSYFSFTKERVYRNFPPTWVYTCVPK